MIITDTQIPCSKHFFPTLLPLIGMQDYEKVLERYYELFASAEWPQNPVLQKHLVNGILPGLALYQISLEGNPDKPTVLRKVENLLKRLYDDQRIPLQRLGRLPFVYSILRAYIKTAMQEYPPEGWTIDWKQVDGEAVRFDMQRCYYHDTLSTYGASELTAAFCAIDDHIYGEMSKQVVWQRTQTIGRGAQKCDFCFARAKK